MLVNRVAQSGIITINLEDFHPDKPPLTFDLKDYLYMELILREKEFRQALNELDWSTFQNNNVCVFCSADAIVPVWAYMLVATYLQPLASKVFFGTEEQFFTQAFFERIQQIDFEQYTQKRVVIKGCSEKPVPEMAYFEVAKRLQPYAQSIMYGEPCSTVPIFKRPRILKPRVKS